jgi:hypothetical protein
MELKYQLELKVNNLIFKYKELFFFFLASSVAPEEPVNIEVLNKTSTSASNLLATPAVRRMAKELQVEEIKLNFIFDYI